ncbi:MAG: hypothetical protein QXH75_07450 [Sulfolobaceae archaeon]|jgi:hypothetical protein
MLGYKAIGNSLPSKIFPINFTVKGCIQPAENPLRSIELAMI